MQLCIGVFVRVNYLKQKTDDIALKKLKIISKKLKLLVEYVNLYIFYNYGIF